MDGCHSPYPVAEALGTQRALPGQGVRAIEARCVRAQAEAAAHSLRVEHPETGDNVGYSHAPMYVPPPFATPPGVALTF